MTLFFCEAFLVIQAVCSARFRQDLTEVCEYLNGYAGEKWQLITARVEKAAAVADGISNGIVAAVISSLLMIVAGILLAAIFYILPVGGVVYGSMAYIKSNKFDSYNKWAMVLSGIVFIAAASGNLFSPSMNLLLAWILFQVAVPVFRFIMIPLFLYLYKEYSDMD